MYIFLETINMKVFQMIIANNNERLGRLDTDFIFEIHFICSCCDLFIYFMFIKYKHIRPL